jgi:hypothetical protein
VLTLGVAPQSEGASLAGTVTATPLAANDNHGARIVLVDTDYATLATCDDPRRAAGSWKGEYAFSHLPAGTYRVLAYRTGSMSQISAPIRLEAGQKAKLDIALAPTDPRANIVQNPDGRLDYLHSGAPDRWKRASPKGKPSPWVSSAERVKPLATYRCGAVLKDPAAKVSFRFQTRLNKEGKHGPATVCPLTVDANLRGELTTTLDAERGTVVVQVQSTRPLAEAIERVWVVPETKKSPAR